MCARVRVRGGERVCAAGGRLWLDRGRNLEVPAALTMKASQIADSQAAWVSRKYAPFSKKNVRCELCDSGQPLAPANGP